MTALLAGMMAVVLFGCEKKSSKIVSDENVSKKTDLVFLSPIAKGNENAQGKTQNEYEKAMVEFGVENPDINLLYKSYTAKDYEEKSYDDVVLERVRNHTKGDDVYIMNPDVAYALDKEGYLYDLSDLESAKQLTDAALAQCDMINDKVTSVPMYMIAYGLYVNTDLLDKYGLKIPNTTKEFLDCCKVLKSHGITPMAGNRWWLENFVLTQGFSSLYMEGNTDAKIAALNSGETPISKYMRPGFEFLKEMIDKEYLDADYAYKAEAGDEKDMFLNEEVAFVIHHNTAANDDMYGASKFHFSVIGFPTDDYGQVNLLNAASRLAIAKESEHIDESVTFIEKMCSKETITKIVNENGGIPARKDVEIPKIDELSQVYENMDKNKVIAGQNPKINVEQWGNTCTLIQKLLRGSSVDELMDEFDNLQAESNK